MCDHATPGEEITVIRNNGSIQKIWPFVEPMFRTATDRSSGRYETSDILGELIRGESHLWVTFTMEEEPRIIHTINTRFMQYPRKRALAVIFGCGLDNLIDEWIALLDRKLEKFAYDNGCDMLEMAGRRGWGRKVKDVGWEEKYCFVERPLALEDLDVRKSA